MTPNAPAIFRPGVKIFVAFSLLLFSTAYSSSSLGALIEAGFAGSVSEVRYSTCTGFNAYGSCSDWDHVRYDSYSFMGMNPFSLGDAFSGSFVYDSSTPMILSEDRYQGIYLDATTDFRVDTGYFSEPEEGFIDRPGDVSVVDGRQGLDVFIVSKSYSFADWFLTLSVDLVDSDGNVFNGLELLEDPDYSAFNYRKMHWAFLERATGDQMHVYGDITDIERRFEDPVSVSEPSATGLISLGLMGLYAVRRRVRR